MTQPQNNYAHAAFWLGSKLWPSSFFFFSQPQAMATQIFFQPQAVPTQIFDSATSCAHTAFLTQSQNDCAHAAFGLSVASYGHAASFWLGHKLCIPTQLFDSATSYGHADFWFRSKLWPRSFLTQPQAMPTQPFDSATSHSNYAAFWLGQSYAHAVFSFCLQSQTMRTQLFDSQNMTHPQTMTTQLFSSSFLTGSTASFAHAAFWLSHKICLLIFLTEPQNMAMHLCDELQNMAMQLFDWTTSYGHVAKPAGNGS